MKKLFVLAVSLLLLASCRNGAGVDAALSESEALMTDHHDSSLVLLKAVDISQIKTRAAKAKYALLYTQAQHKNYETIQSDSLIGIAVSYYKSHGKKDQYAKSLMYNGAALYDMKHYNQAVEKYKMAEQQAKGSSDYFLLGMINSQIGEVYIMTHSDLSYIVARYKLASKYYILGELPKHECSCYAKIGAYYFLMNERDSAFFYIDKSIRIAESWNYSSLLLLNYYTMMLAYAKSNDYAAAKQVGLKAYSKSRTNGSTLSELARAYAYLGMTDSAKYYYNLIPATYNNLVEKYRTLSHIERSAGRYDLAYRYFVDAQIIADSVMNQSRMFDAISTEKQFDTQQLVAQNQILKEKSRNWLYIAGLAILSAILLLLAYQRRRHQIVEQIAFIEQLQSDRDHNMAMLNHLTSVGELQEKTKIAIESSLLRIDSIIDMYYQHEEKSHLFAKEFAKKMNLGEFNKEFLDEIIVSVNACKNNIITDIATAHPSLTEDDLSFICFLMLNFSKTSITAIYGYENIQSVYQRTKRLSDKMGLKVPLKAYLLDIQRGGNSAS
ncbi:MAG: hypothetical protein PHP76_04780 [Bacteroidales bacterium]|nr:hypothetical protein [Bacteroidales bacterium]